MSTLEVVVIGAGPSGVAAAVSLLDRGLQPLLVDRAEQVGSSWRGRYDRLKLNTARPLSHLPNRRYPRGTAIFPTRSEVADHLDRHAHEEGIRLRLGTTVERIEALAGGWRLHTSTGEIDSRQVIVATGYEHTPFLPEWPGMKTFEGELMHSSAYQNPKRLQGKRVLVVGAGSSGMEIVHDVSTGGAAVAWLSIRTPPNILPRRGPGGLPSDFIATPLYRLPPKIADSVGGWGRRLCFGDLTAYGLPTPDEGPFERGARVGKAPAIVDKEVVDAIRANRFRVVCGVATIDGDTVELTSGERLKPDVVICATGYRRGLESMVGHLDVLDADGVPRVAGEVSAAPGLRFIGFMSRPGLIGYVAAQSKRVAKRVVRELESQPADIAPQLVRGLFSQESSK
jgi:cation diffusion facilitator CzcD-associated flavoprotein CzcO